MIQEVKRILVQLITTKYGNVNQTEKNKKVQQINSAKSFEELGLNFTEACKLLKLYGIPLVITEEDKKMPVDLETTNTPRKKKRMIESTDDLVCVHKTQTAPSSCKIKSDKEANARADKKIVINNVRYDYSYPLSRNTVHFSVNDESSHIFGEGDEKKYAVIIPFTELPQDRIKEASPMDTYVEGGVALNEKCWILCPSTEMKKCMENNVGVNVIGYEGEKISGYSQLLLTQLGYKPESLNVWAWEDEQDQVAYATIIGKEGFSMTPLAFSGKKAQIVEAQDATNRIIAILQLIQQKGLLKKPEDVKKMCEELEEIKYPNFEGLVTEVGGERNRILQLINDLETNGFSISKGAKNAIRLIESFDQEGLYFTTKQKEEVAHSLREGNSTSNEIDYVTSYMKEDCTSVDTKSTILLYSILETIYEKGKNKLALNSNLEGR